MRLERWAVDGAVSLSLRYANCGRIANRQNGHAAPKSEQRGAHEHCAAYTTSVTRLAAVNCWMRNIAGGTIAYGLRSSFIPNAASATNPSTSDITLAGGPAFTSANQRVGDTPQPERAENGAEHVQSRWRVRIPRFRNVPLRHGDHRQRQGQIDQKYPPPTWALDEIATDEGSDCRGDPAEAGPCADCLAAVRFAE